MKLSISFLILSIALQAISAPASFTRENGVRVLKRVERTTATSGKVVAAAQPVKKLSSTAKKTGVQATQKKISTTPGTVANSKKPAGVKTAASSKKKRPVPGSTGTTSAKNTTITEPALDVDPGASCPVPKRKPKTAVRSLLEYIGVVEARMPAPDCDGSTPGAGPSTAPVVAGPSTSKGSKIVAACKSNIKKVATKISAKLDPRVATVFHATCRDRATAIAKQMKSPAKLQLSTNLRWPNEFSFLGGFYTTPSEESAELFGAHFLDCRKEGGIVVMKLALNRANLNVKELGDGDAAQIFHSDQDFIGGRISARLASTRGKVNKLIPRLRPTDNELDSILAGNAVFDIRPEEDNRLRALVADFRGPTATDVVAGTVPIASEQVEAIREHVDFGFGLDALLDPFPQVVLVTDRAMEALQPLSITPLSACRAEASDKVLAQLDSLEADAEAARQAAQAGVSAVASP
ncbi:hypothetical protein MKEN_00540000 [Mycena kentingensis (nom. inval.)]|nr:hypothetical protein MKEN_00540000 [Mycena kentingensis (nom. inval.)]